MRWWNVTCTPNVPPNLCLAAVTDDGRAVPVAVEPDPTLPNRLKVVMPDDPFPNGPFGTQIDALAPGFALCQTRWTLPPYGATNVEADTPLNLEPSVAPFPPADLYAPEIRPFDPSVPPDAIVHTVLPPEALAVAYPPVRDVDYVRGDAWGVTTPQTPPPVRGCNTTPPNMWMSYLLPLYPPEWITYYLGEYCRRPYTHLLLQHADQWGAYDPSAIVGAAQQAKQHGLFVAYWAAAKTEPIAGGWANYAAVVLPAMQALIDAQAVDLPIVSGEINLAMSPEDLIDVVTNLAPWLRARGITRLGLHFTSNYGSYEPNGMNRQVWWQQMAALGVTHLFWQADPSQSAGVMGGELYEARMYVAGCGVNVVAAELIGEKQLYGQASEIDGMRVGWELSCCTRLDPSFPPVYGSLNGLPLSDAAGNPVITA